MCAHWAQSFLQEEQKQVADNINVRRSQTESESENMQSLAQAKINFKNESYRDRHSPGQ